MFARKKNLASALVAMVSLLIACQTEPRESQTSKLTPGAASMMQEKSIPPTLDKSPMDMIYYPVDYPVKKMSGKIDSPPIARVIYSRPSKDGRLIFGNLVKYGERWRLGANEATEIEFFTDVTITGKKVNKGRYIIYCIPYPDKWTLILNSDLFVWGLKIHSSKDLYMFDIPVIPLKRAYEVFTMSFQPTDEGMQLMMAWDKTEALLPIKY